MYGTVKKIFTTANFSTTNPIWNGRGLNSEVRGVIATTNCLNHDMASFVFCVLYYYLVFIFITSCVFFHYMCIAVLHTLVAGLIAKSQYSEGPATGHLDTGFSWFPCVYKQMLRWFPKFQVATACFSFSPPDLKFLDPYFIFMHMRYNHCHRVTAQLQLNILSSSSSSS